jgi:hypothetical protein
LFFVDSINLDGTNPETSDQSWNLNNTLMSVNNWSHDGAITNTLFTINTHSTLTINQGAILNLGQGLVSAGSLSAINLSNLNVQGSAYLLTTFDSISVRLNNVTNNNIATNPASTLMAVSGGDLFVDTLTLGGGDVSLSTVLGYIQNSTLTSANGNTLFVSTSNLNLFNDNVTNTAGVGVRFETVSYRIDGLVINSVGDGLQLTRNSKGYLNNLSGASSAGFGVNLLSGSSFSNGGSNTITGALGDVNTGAAGASSWGTLITDDFPPIVNSQYVTITPS